MGELITIELYTNLIPSDIRSAFPQILGELADGSELSALVSSDERVTAEVWIRTTPTPGSERVPNIRVGISLELATLPLEEIGAAIAGLLPAYINNPDIEGGRIEDVEEGIFAQWEHGQTVIVNSNPYTASTPLGKAIPTTLTQANIAWAPHDLGLRFTLQARFSIRLSEFPYLERLWRGDHPSGVAFYDDIEQLATLLHIPSGIHRFNYQDFRVTRDTFLNFTHQLLNHLTTHPELLDQHEITITRTLAMALNAGYQPPPTTNSILTNLHTNAQNLNE